MINKSLVLTLDVGNSQIFGGVYQGETLCMTFRKNSKRDISSDEYGLFLRLVLRENALEPNQIRAIVISSVVPELNHSISSACIKYFGLRPLLLDANSKTGLTITCKNPAEVGSDRIATAVAAINLFPNQNIALVDLGTATTICVITKNREWEGGIIVPGLKVAMTALEQNTSKLPSVEITIPKLIVGRDTVENIQAGLYYSTLGLMRLYLSKLQKEHFHDEPMVVVGTGGFARLFENEKIFDMLIPDLVLQGLRRVLLLNENA